ncbi:MAG: ABC transporter ATP-binding protein [Oscillospiraceae bacterium]|nr:ABC transporter ATP-binding protein [Oscillospiraceae bacterium]
MLSIRDLHVRFLDDSHEAVRGIDLDIASGEIVGLVGESGSGKSVTAMTVAGLIERKRAAISGSVTLDGRELLTLPRSELRAIQGSEIGVVFQEPMTAFDPLMRVGAQVGEALALHSGLDAAARRERVMEALSEADLDARDIYEKYPHECSGGMLQRALIAAAVVTRPKLLIADEPTTALDVSVQGQILALLRRLNGELGTSMLFISHDLGVVRRLCDRVAVMRRGVIVERGTVEDIFRAPQHEYTRALLDAVIEIKRGDA